MHTGAELEAGGRLLIGSNEGLAVPSAAAVTVLLAFFGPLATGDPPSQWLRRSIAAGLSTNRAAAAVQCRQPKAGVAATTVRDTAAASAQHQCQSTEAVQCALMVSKADMRRCLAFVSGCCPDAQPTQGLLKQVFLYFELASGHHRRAWTSKQLL